MVARKLSGRAWVFGDALDVDWEICSFEVVREEQGRGTLVTMSQRKNPRGLTFRD